jgi:hypothetical protein
MSTTVLCLLAWGFVSAGVAYCRTVERRLQEPWAEGVSILSATVFVVLPGVYFLELSGHRYPDVIGLGCFVTAFVTAVFLQGRDMWRETRYNHRALLRANDIDLEGLYREVEQLEGPAYLYAPVTRRHVLFPWRSRARQN